jgi:hypothetical protein
LCIESLNEKRIIPSLSINAARSARLEREYRIFEIPAASARTLYPGNRLIGDELEYSFDQNSMDIDCCFCHTVSLAIALEKRDRDRDSRQISFSKAA